MTWTLFFITGDNITTLFKIKDFNKDFRPSRCVFAVTYLLTPGTVIGEGM
jgi:hypothetical protein